MGNFDYLKEEKRFDTFSNVAIAAEKVIYISGIISIDYRWK